MRNKAITLDPSKFTDIIDGEETGLFVLQNGTGMEVDITNYGGRIVRLLVPDAYGRPTDVVVGFSSLAGYVKSSEPYYGSIIGRYGNRIANGKFTLENKTYTLFTNNGVNTLHGGKKGFQTVIWKAQQLDKSTLVLKYLSPDGEENFPGNLHVQVTYSLTSTNELVIDYEASTDKPTIINLTNHAFYNLNGEGSGTINNHLLMINAHQYTPIDSTSIPFGKLETVAGTPFDFSSPVAIGSRLDVDNEQLKNGNGYDHNFVLNGHGMKHAATVVGDRSGIIMTVLTEEPGLQFYGGNFMNGVNIFKSGVKDTYQTSFCLETQHFPDSPNHPSFPTTVLVPGRLYKTSSVYRFT